MTNSESFDLWPHYTDTRCPRCFGETMEDMLPVRKLEWPEREIITDPEEIDKLEQRKKTPKDIEWVLCIICLSCGLVIEADDYDETLESWH
jgi:hypothetical protein